MRRSSKTVRIAALLALAAALAVPVASAEAATPPPPAPAETTAHIKGWARLEYPDPADDIQVTVDARGTYTKDSPWFPVKSEGTLRLSHKMVRPNGVSRTYWADMEVDCVTRGGPNATVTGRIVAASNNPKDADFPMDDPLQAMLKDHVRMGMSFYVPGKGGGPARVGLSGPADMTLSKCMAPAPFDKVLKGGFTLK
ncbi:hypothetical protein ABZ924_17010 [Streptomyces sp. NPDC046876]|uniref:hypothetical protein n=1 Tax=Streptomyces sp. NPDC046876 TaxID=3155616 RepID=UPI0033C9772D